MQLEPSNITTTPIPRKRSRLIGVILAILIGSIAIIVTWGVMTSSPHDVAGKTVTPAADSRH